MAEGEPVEMELLLGWPSILRVFQIADMRIAEVQGSGFPILGCPGGGP
jgi:hypothetical protein